VVSVSADAVIDEKKQMMFLARLQLMNTKDEMLKKKIVLQPGMVVTAEIKTGKRSVLSYFLSPLTEHLSESLHER
jgi:hemolysin D